VSLFPESWPCDRYHMTDADLKAFWSLVANVEFWDPFGDPIRGHPGQSGIRMWPIRPEADAAAMDDFWTLCGTYGSEAVFAALAAASRPGRFFHCASGRDDPGVLAEITAALSG
jgi:hypothetical protein